MSSNSYQSPRKQRSAAAGRISYMEQDESSDPVVELTSMPIPASGHSHMHIQRIIEASFKFVDSSSFVQTISDGSDLTSEKLLSPDSSLSINRPIVVTSSPEDIGIKLPRGKNVDSPTTIREIAEIVGMSHPVTVMDVQSQEEQEGWVMTDLVDYFEDEDRRFFVGQSGGGERDSDSGSPPKRTSPRGKSPGFGSGRKGPPPRVLNQISLEFSQTPLRNRVLSPQFVRDLDWIDNFWPEENKKADDYPNVQYYCLTSTAGCYTDWHVDFGGTSVWYTVLEGKKEFVLAPPSEINLKQYEAWLCRPDQHEVFFPDVEGVENVIRVTLEKGCTLLVPSGWLHAVYTPCDSIVIGGNFLHGLAMSQQLDIYCIEMRTRVPTKFRFPHFVRMMIYAGLGYLKKMQKGAVNPEEINGLRRFADALRSWTASCPDGDADRPLSIAGTALDCAKRAGCNNYNEVVDKIFQELDRIGRNGDVPSPCQNPPSRKLKLSLKGSKAVKPSQPATQNRQESISHESAKRKLKLKLGNLGSTLKDAAAADDESDFQISIPSSNLVGKKRNAEMHSSSQSRNSKIDPGDEEWMPGQDDYTPQRSKVSPMANVRGVSRLTTAKQKSPKTRQQPAPKAKKMMSARDRLKKKMKF